MRKYESKEGKIESALSIVQRKCSPPDDCFDSKFDGTVNNLYPFFSAERLEVLKRPEGTTSGAPDAVEGHES